MREEGGTLIYEYLPMEKLAQVSSAVGRERLAPSPNERQ